MAETKTLDQVEFPGEEDVYIASPDYIELDVPFIVPGPYKNNSREVTVPADPDKFVTQKKVWVNGIPEVVRKDGEPISIFNFVVDFGEHGLTSVLDGTVVKYAPRYYMNTDLREVRYGGVGEVSSVHRYLSAFASRLGLDPKNFGSMKFSDLREALAASQNLPVIVETELEDDYRDRPKGAKTLYTKFFKSDNGEGYVPAKKLIQPDGSVRIVKARARIARFKAPE